jgi:hypothetical protein
MVGEREFEAKDCIEQRYIRRLRQETDSDGEGWPERFVGFGSVTGGTGTRTIRLRDNCLLRFGSAGPPKKKSPKQGEQQRRKGQKAIRYRPMLRLCPGFR